LFDRTRTLFSARFEQAEYVSQGGLNWSVVTDYGRYEGATVDHERIKRWVGGRNGTPGRVPSTASADAGVLRFEFPDADDDPFESLDWDAFFEQFEAEELALLYRDPTDGEAPDQCYELTDRVLVGEY
jgi:hypothetical protein